MHSQSLTASSIWRLKPLCASRYSAGRMSVTCVLYRVGYRRTGVNDPSLLAEPMYAIGMEGGGTRSLCLAGDDEAQARRLFRDMARLTVTPCTLRDVMEDMGFGG